MARRSEQVDAGGLPDLAAGIHHHDPLGSHDSHIVRDEHTLRETIMGLEVVYFVGAASERSRSAKKGAQNRKRRAT
jgi:hypothetical protein